MSDASALEGVTVLDLTRLLPGAVATMWLANFGAKVIKIEQPGVGDYARTLLADGLNPVFGTTNRGKKSVAIDLKDPRGKEALMKLVATSDVVIESFRPGVMDRLELGYPCLAERNPRVIHIALSGYGQTGLHAQLAGHDVNYLAMGGVLDLIGENDGPPVIPGVQIADLAGGSMQSVIGVLLALQARERTGRGQSVDVSMTDGVTALLAIPLAALASGATAQRRGNEILSGRFACYNVYPARDGRWLAVGALERKFWVNLCRELQLDSLVDDQLAPEPRQAEVKAAISAAFRARDAAEWFALLGNKDCCVTPVRTAEEVAANSSPVIPRMSETPGLIGSPAPGLGEHTDEVLLGAGIGTEELRDLRREGVIQ